MKFDSWAVSNEETGVPELRHDSQKGQAAISESKTSNNEKYISIFV